MGKTFPCRICNKNVKDGQRAIQCDKCDYWVHTKCSFINTSDYKVIREQPEWICIKCINEGLPFSNLSKDQFRDYILGINDSDLKYNNLNQNLLKCIEIFENPDTFANVIPYSQIEDISRLKLNATTSLGILHLNISSISSHIDDLKLLLNLCKKKFHIICLSESRIRKGELPTTNIHIPGYTYEEIPTESSAGE